MDIAKMMSLKRKVIALLVLAATLSSSTAQSVKVLTANPDGAQRGDTWAQLNGSVQITSDSSICLRFRIRVFRLLTAVLYLFDIRDSYSDPISFEVYFEKIRTIYGGYGKFYSLPDNLVTNTWYHYCQAQAS
ncbi:uncharacterized protein LOC125177878 [Hyalella azteca]|uniref:Uncharacterized protein LOC125177878 n=1 Tax=Hyalella azteca TaxID=294128 RepID=A0A979FJH4_HYAAZ|nr:uncharacterized protein LOC125177878 [Hyalella azteca]